MGSLEFFSRNQKWLAREGYSPEDFDFRELFDSHYAAVLRHLVLILGDRSIAEDMAQEAFIKLYESPPRDLTNLQGWLIRVSTNLAYNYLRGEKARKRREGAEALSREQFEYDFLLSNEVGETRRVLADLDDRDRVCLILKFSGFSYDEIAKIAGIKKNCVGKTLARAVEKFKRAYERKRENVL